MTITEYKKLKQQLRKVEKLPKNEQIQNNLLELQQQVAAAEKIDIIYKFNFYNTQLTDIKKLIGCWTYYKKDTTKLIEKQADIENKLSAIMQQDSSTVQQESMKKSVAQQTHAAPQQTGLEQEVLKMLKQIDSKVTKDSAIVSDPTYYIINLAWSKEDGFIINTVRDFLNMTNHIHSSREVEEARGETMMSWKFNYDTIEERSSVKTTLTAADHLLSVLRSRYPGQTDAEVFGKMIKY